MQITLHCKYCRKSLHVGYIVTGNRDEKVLQGLTMTCPVCHNKHPRAMSLHNITEGEFLKQTVGSKVFV